MVLKLTSKRELILTLVKDSLLPLTAKSVHQKVKKNINLATVYRGLEYLEEQGLIEAFTISCSKEGVVRFYYRKENKHSHFFHCQNCHTFIRLRSCTLNNSMKKSKELKGCLIQDHVMYVLGLCMKCQSGFRSRK